jgi:hypothetical protein
MTVDATPATEAKKPLYKSLFVLDRTPSVRHANKTHT